MLLFYPDPPTNNELNSSNCRCW